MNAGCSYTRPAYRIETRLRIHKRVMQPTKAKKNIQPMSGHVGIEVTELNYDHLNPGSSETHYA